MSSFKSVGEHDDDPGAKWRSTYGPSREGKENTADLAEDRRLFMVLVTAFQVPPPRRIPPISFEDSTELLTPALE